MMNKNKADIILVILNTLLCAAIIAMTATMMKGWSLPVVVLCYILGGVGIALGAVMFFIRKQPILKGVFVLACCAFVFILVFSLMSQFGNLDDYPTDAEKIERVTEIIKNAGSWGMVVFVLIQILQVVILPLPAIVCYVPGSMIWGAWQATLLASVGVLIGSFICYFLGRVFGKRIAVWIAGKENTEKYISILGKRGKLIFVIMQILPFFPDDILCIVAGVTSMNLPFFAITMLIVRPCIIAVYCFLGSGTVIPFSGWGIYVWIAIFAVCITLAVLSFIYQERFENWLTTKLRKLGRKRSERAQPKRQAETETNTELGSDIGPATDTDEDHTET